MFNSAVVLVTPSRIFNSAAVLVTAVPPIASLLAGILKVALSSTVATVVPSYCLKTISFVST
jgi:hypothetical protein